MVYTWGMDTMTEALKNAIARDGRTAADIATAGGVNKGQLSRFMRAQRSMTLDTADKVCEALGVDVRLVKRRMKGRTA